MGSLFRQEEFFCSERWTKKRVDLLIETLARASLFEEWDYEHNRTTGLSKAKDNLLEEFGVHFTDQEIVDALELLHQRFTVWRKIMAEPQMLIDRWSKRVSAPPHVWERMISEDGRVKWYGDDGEKAYDDLEVIFKNPYKGADGFVFLGEVSGIHSTMTPLDQVELPPLPVAPTPPRGQRTHLEDHTPTRPAATTTVLDSPVAYITKEAFQRSAEARKHKKKLFLTPNSPHSSVGSSSGSVQSPFEKIKAKFGRSG